MKAVQLSALIVFFIGASASQAADEGAKVTFVDHVFPILEDKCVNCHNTDEAKGGLDLASYGATLTGGSGGEVVVSEEPGASRLFTLAAHTEEPVMPPKGTQASDAELKIISDWIAGGLLETGNSKARKADKPKLDLTSVSATGKPEGPPAMPEHLILEPAIVTDRPNAIPALAHSPWAPIVAVAGQKQILLYHSKDFDLLGVLTYPEGFPQTLSFSPNGAYLSCGGGRAGKSGNVVTWDIKTGERVIEVGKEFDIVLGADVSPDLKNAVMGGPGRNIKLWDTVAGEQINSIKKHTDWLLTAAYSPDGVIYATGDRNGGLYVWEAATGYEFYTLKGHTLAVTDIDWRMDGNVLASCSEDGQVMLWEMNAGSQIKKWEAHSGGAQGIDIAPDGSIATVGRDKNLKIWKGDGSAIRTVAASDDVVLSVAFSEDSKRVFTGDIHGNIKVWSVESGAELARIDSNPPPIEQQLAYSEKRIGDLTSQLPKLEEGAKSISTELASAKSEVAEVEKRLAAATKARDEQKSSFAKQDAVVKAVSTEVGKLQQDAAAKAAAVKTIGETINATATALKSHQDEVDRLAAELLQEEGKLQSAATALAAAQASVAPPTPESQAGIDALIAASSAAKLGRDQKLSERNEANSRLASAVAQHEESKSKLAPAQTDEQTAVKALAAKETELAEAKKQLASIAGELKKAEDLVAAETKQKESSAAKLASIAAKENEAKKSVSLAKSELQENQYLQKKWQAAAINLTAVRESENLDDMAVKLDDMLAEEVEAKKQVADATTARSDAEKTLSEARKTVTEGTKALQVKSNIVLERALEMVANRAAAELREDAILQQPLADQGTLAAEVDTFAVTSTNASETETAADSEVQVAIGQVAAETLSYKTPEEINGEVSQLKLRLNELEEYLESTYSEANKTKSSVVAADQVARETPKVIADRAMAEEEAARELAEAEAERKRQEQALAEQTKRIEELRAKYLATLPKREE